MRDGRAPALVINKPRGRGSRKQAQDKLPGKGLIDR